MVCRDSKGKLVGFLASVDHPASRIIGPGVSENEEVALIYSGTYSTALEENARFSFSQ